ncbi:hypothetical protein Bca4012_092267 [Brassica carinata]
MANPWLTIALASPLNPASPAGILRRPPPLPDPPDPLQFPPPLPSSRSPPLSFADVNPLASSPAALLLSSYSNLHFPVPINPRSGNSNPTTVTNPNLLCSSLQSSTFPFKGLLGGSPSFVSNSSQPTHPLPPTIPASIPLTLKTQSTAPVDWVSKVKKTIDRSLERFSPVSLSPSGIPRVIIPEEVYQKGAELHRDFVVCRFFGRVPTYSLIQNHLEIHMSPATNSVLVRLPNEFSHQKVTQKGFWYVDTTMFHVSQWAAHADDYSPSLKRVQLWAHLIGVSFDLIHRQGLSHIAGQIGEPKETDDWTLNLTSISIAHVKVEVDTTVPLPKVVEVGRQNGSFVNVSVEYPWVPPICSHSKEVGHISRNCPLLPIFRKQKSSSTLHKISQEKQPDLTTSNVAVLSPKRVHAEAPVAAATVTHAETTDAPTSEIPTLDPTVQSLPSAAPMVVDPQVVPSEISSTPPELGSVSGSDVEMEDASSPSPQDFFLALPALFFLPPH